MLALSYQAPDTGHSRQDMPQPGSASGAARSTVVSAPLATSCGVAGSAGEPPLIGREREMATVHTALAQAIGGRGQLVLLAGEPGIGKTRLLEEGARLGLTRQARVLWSWGWEGDGAPALWPWLQILRTLLHASDQTPCAPELTARAAELAQCLADFWEPESPPSALIAFNPAVARFRLFDRLSILLKQLSQEQPVVLLLDDLHWADSPSLRLLHFLARELRDTRLCVFGAYRDVEVSGAHPLGTLLGTLPREAHHLHVQGLSVSEVADFLFQTTGVEPAVPVVAALHAQTAGNPFFLREMAPVLDTDGALTGATGGTPAWLRPIPPRIRETIRQRLAHLPQPCLHLLTVAAVIGRDFNLELLRQVDGATSEATCTAALAVLHDALAARLIVEVPERLGSYRFVHTLIRETIYEALSLAERSRWHRQVAETLERLQGTLLASPMAELADHFMNAVPAGTSDRALHYLCAAGQQAMACLAYEEAVRRYEQALQLLAVQESGTHRMGTMLLALGDALWSAGEPQRARAVFLEAAQIAQAASVPELLAQAALGVARVRLKTGDLDDVLVRLLEAALRGLGDEVSALRVHLLARLVEALYFSPEVLRRQALSVQAVALAQRLGDQATLAVALTARHVALWEPAYVEERLALATEAQHLAEEANYSQAILESWTYKILALFELGEIVAMDRELARYARHVAAHGLPRWRWSLGVMQAGRALFAGRFAEGERLAREAFAACDTGEYASGMAYFAAQMAIVWRAQGRLAELAPTLMSGAAQFVALPLWRCGLAVLHSDQGNREAAQHELERLAAHDFNDLPHDINWLPSLVILAEVSCGLEDRARAARLYTLLAPYATRNVVLGTVAASSGVVAHSLGLLATLLGQWEKAQAHFDMAVCRHAQMEALPALAQSRYDYASMLLARGCPGDTEGAATLLAQAADSASALGMTRLSAQSEARQAQLAPPTPSRDTTASVATHEAVFYQEGKEWRLGFAGHTVRQRDVKGLHYLAYLLQHPTQEVHVLDLLALTDTLPETRGLSGPAEPHLVVAGLPGGRALPDAPARAAYRARLQALREDLDEAEHRHDLARSASLQAEFDAITEALSAVYGARNYARAADEAIEKARKAVTNRIRGALAKLQPVHPALWQHLFTALKTGTCCTYRPVHLPAWTFE